MFLGEYKISKLQNFILGYSMGSFMARNSETPEDIYFENPGFYDWFLKTYKHSWTSFWITPFLEEADGDEKKALDLYFNYLEEYAKCFRSKN